MSECPHEPTGSGPGPLSCERARELVMPYVDGELDAAPLAEVERHLSACACCRAEVAAMRAIDERARTAFLREDRVAAERVRARADAEIARLAGSKAAPVGRPPVSWRRVGTAVAAVLLMATVAIGLLPGPVAAEFARDHTDCLRSRPEWRRGADAAAMAREYLDGTPAPAARGYALTRAAGCALGGIPYVHLVYEAPGREPVSVFAGRRLGGLGGILRLGRRAASELGVEVIEMHRGTLELHVVGGAGEAGAFADALE